mmetsp:Transcript_120527/g.300667  ORF Transcript_120527/g.300667 Transcript_120527/m.300667 type:complete len:207 (-) Transcript_120527:530-1150(-)
MRSVAGFDCDAVLLDESLSTFAGLTLSLPLYPGVPPRASNHLHLLGDGWGLLLRRPRLDFLLLRSRGRPKTNRTLLGQGLPLRPFPPVRGPATPRVTHGNLLVCRGLIQTGQQSARQRGSVLDNRLNSPPPCAPRLDVRLRQGLHLGDAHVDIEKPSPKTGVSLPTPRDSLFRLLLHLVDQAAQLLVGNSCFRKPSLELRQLRAGH